MAVYVGTAAIPIRDRGKRGSARLICSHHVVTTRLTVVCRGAAWQRAAAQARRGRALLCELAAVEARYLRKSIKWPTPATVDTYVCQEQLQALEVVSQV